MPRPSFVIVDTATKCKVEHPRTRRDSYPTEKGAKLAMAGMKKLAATTERLYVSWQPENLVVMEYTAYRAQVPKKIVKNLVSGADVEIDADTPSYCDPSQESYWSS